MFNEQLRRRLTEMAPNRNYAIAIGVIATFPFFRKRNAFQTGYGHKEMRVFMTETSVRQ